MVFALLLASILLCQNLHSTDQTECCPIELQDSCNPFNVFGDVLIWWANESGAENWAQVFSTTDVGINVDVLQVSFGCDVGFRVGIGSCISQDQWDTQLYYTRFRTQDKDGASTTGEIASAYLGNFYIANDDGTKTGPAYQKARMKWTIDFNTFDWELGCNCCLCGDFSLRPFIGLKGGWIHQTIRTHWQTPIFPSPDPFFPPTPFDTGQETLKNDFWGIGPSAGLNTKWELCGFCSHVFSLFGDFSGALMYGRWTFEDDYENNILEQVVIDVSSINGAATMVRGFMGIGWDFDCDTWCFALRVGYEGQIWFDQLQLYTLNSGRMNNPLTLQGGTIDIQFHF